MFTDTDTEATSATLVAAFLYVMRRFGFTTHGHLSIIERAEREDEMAQGVGDIVARLKTRDSLPKVPRFADFDMPRKVSFQMCTDCPLRVGCEMPKHPVGHVILADQVNHLAIAWGCKLNAFDYADAYYPEVMDKLRRLSVATLRGYGYAVDPFVDTHPVLWAANPRWQRLARCSGVPNDHIRAIREHLSRLQWIVEATPSEQFALPMR